jgi:hypothetical protein
MAESQRDIVVPVSNADTVNAAPGKLLFRLSLESHTQKRRNLMFIKRLILAYILLLLCQAPAITRPLDEERIGFTVPTAPWTLTLPQGGLVIQQRQVKPDGRSAYFLLTDDKSKLNISFFIEPVKNCQDSKACRDMVWRLGNPSWKNPQKVAQAEIGEVSYFEFFMPSFRGAPVKQQHMYVEFVKEGYWVDLHISKVLYKPEEHELFERLIKSIKFDMKAP